MLVACAFATVLFAVVLFAVVLVMAGPGCPDDLVVIGRCVTEPVCTPWFVRGGVTGGGGCRSIAGMLDLR